jgi:hypothetical protein
MISVMLCADDGGRLGQVIVTVSLPAVPVAGDQVLVGDDNSRHFEVLPRSACYKDGRPEVAITVREL